MDEKMRSAEMDRARNQLNADHLCAAATNQRFPEIKLVNLKDSEKAESDLEKIILLCDAIENKIKPNRKAS